MTNTKTFTTVPAQPGFFALYPVYLEDRVFDLLQDPIIAWAIERVEQDGLTRTQIFPVTYEGLPDTDEFGLPPVLRPDGSVVLPAMGTFDSAAKYLLYLREEVGGVNRREALEAAGN